VFSVSLWLVGRRLVHHKDTENTEVAQRNPKLRHYQVVKTY